MDDRTYVWIVGRDTFQWLRLPLRRDAVRRWADELQRIRGSERAERLRAVLQSAHDGMAAPVLKRIGARATRLVIVPDDAMHAIPFGALHNPDTKRFIIERLPVETAASATFYVSSLVADEKLAKGRATALLFGNPAFDRTLPFAESLDDLQAAEAEVGEIRGLYDSTVRVGAEATIPALVQLAPRNTIVHLAAHGVVNAVVPDQSLLLLAPTGGDHGVLRPKELMERLPKLPATRLVILGACSSAGGAAVGADGIAPLVRPFMAAGVPGVVGTLWSVPDATAREILVSFHRRYRNGEDAAVALQGAQCDQIRKHLAHPFDAALPWAAFQMFGHASAPRAAAHNEKEKEPP
ncbi:MAG TPA: CHAT domain-containing protein [Thermoanaerobaculia bacterium]